jgi:hypothetical protein
VTVWLWQTIDLRHVEYNEGPQQRNDALLAFGLRVIDLMQLVEHNARAVFAATDLGIERCRLTVGEPRTAGIATGLCFKAEQQRVDTAIQPAGGSVLRPLIRNRPRPYPRRRASLDRRDDAIRYGLIKVSHVETPNEKPRTRRSRHLPGLVGEKGIT